jgi:ATP synthase protein I
MKQDLKGLGTYGTVGLEFSLSLLFGLLGGQWIDKKLGSTPWFTLIGLGFGMAAGVRSLWRALQAAKRELLEEEQAAREARRRYHERANAKMKEKSNDPLQAPRSDT